MAAPPVPERIPPLSWRKPAWAWTPLALTLAVGWPALLFYDDPGPRQLALAALFIVFALALVSLGAAWAIGQPPKTRRTVILHVVIAGALASLAAPFVLTRLVAVLAARDPFGFDIALAMTPLALVLGLPGTLLSGIVFGWIALARPRPVAELADDELFRHDVQPFR